MIFNKKLDNILICGGYNHIGILLIEKILCEKMDYNIIIFDNLNNMRAPIHPGKELVYLHIQYQA